MEAPFNRIQRLWNNIRSGQMDKVFECFLPNIVVIFNGIRYSKESIIDKLDFFACRTYTIEELQVTVYEDTVLQTIYDSKIKKRIICRFCNKKAMKPSLFIVSMTFLCLCRDTWKRVLPMIKCFHPVFFQQNKNVLFLI